MNDNYAYTYDTPTEPGRYWLATTDNSYNTRIVEAYLPHNDSKLRVIIGNEYRNAVYQLDRLPQLPEGAFYIWCRIPEPGSVTGKPPITLPGWAIRAGIQHVDVLTTFNNAVQLKVIDGISYSIYPNGFLNVSYVNGTVTHSLFDSRAAYELYLAIKRLMSGVSS